MYNRPIFSIPAIQLLYDLDVFAEQINTAHVYAVPNVL